MLERILVPVDGSELSYQILGQVRRLLLRRDAEVLLVRVVTEPELVASQGEDAVTVARRDLEARAGKLRAEGAQVDTSVLVGDPAERVLRLANEWQPSLVALSTHGRSGIARWVRGSVAERILRGSSFPLLLGNPQAVGKAVGDARFSRIVVPLDGSPEADRVLPVVADIAGLYASEVVLLYAIETVVTGDLGSPAAIASVTREEALAILEKRRTELPGLEVRALVKWGNPGVVILEASEEEKADLIALSTHGRSGVARWIYGSTAEHVLRHASRPLLVRRATKPAAEQAAEAADAAWKTA